MGNDKEKTATFNVPKKDSNGNVMLDDNGNIIYEKTRTETVPKGNNATFMSQEMVDYMESHGLAMDRTGNNYSHSADEWDVAITSLEARLEELGTDTQQQMVYIQGLHGAVQLVPAGRQHPDFQRQPDTDQSGQGPVRQRNESAWKGTVPLATPAGDSCAEGLNKSPARES